MKSRAMVSIATISALLVLSSCGSDSSTSDSSTSDSPADEPTSAVDTPVGAYDYGATTDGATTEGTTAPATASGIQVVDTSIGQVLADADGYTLYIFTNDTAGQSTCLEGCIDTWPAAAGEPVTIGEVELVTITRPDGTEQLAIGDKPLYTYAGDAAAGDVAGQAVGDVWFAMGADGQPIS